MFYSTRHHGNCARGKGPTAANVPRKSLVAAVTAAAAAATAAAAAVSREAFRFPSLVAGNDLNLGERWGRGRLQDR
jgi:hypothetical protein